MVTGLVASEIPKTMHGLLPWNSVAYHYIQKEVGYTAYKYHQLTGAMRHLIKHAQL